MRSQIMYIERKGTSSLDGTGRIGRVSFSRTFRTVYYRGRTLQPLKHPSGRANYVDVDTGEHFWVSGPKKTGNDTLTPALIDIDPDVREEYWRDIRHLPEHAHDATVRSSGRHFGDLPTNVTNRRPPK